MVAFRQRKHPVLLTSQYNSFQAPLCSHMCDLRSVSSSSQVIYADAIALQAHSLVNAQQGSNTQKRLNKKTKQWLEEKNAYTFSTDEGVNQHLSIFWLSFSSRILLCINCSNSSTFPFPICCLIHKTGRLIIVKHILFWYKARSVWQILFWLLDVFVFVE